MTAIGHVQANIRTSLECPREGKSHWDHSDRVVLACLNVFTRKHIDHLGLVRIRPSHEQERRRALVPYRRSVLFHVLMKHQSSRFVIRTATAVHHHHGIEAERLGCGHYLVIFIEGTAADAGIEIGTDVVPFQVSAADRDGVTLIPRPLCSRQHSRQQPIDVTVQGVVVVVEAVADIQQVTHRGRLGRRDRSRSSRKGTQDRPPTCHATHQHALKTPSSRTRTSNDRKANTATPDNHSMSAADPCQ